MKATKRRYLARVHRAMRFLNSAQLEYERECETGICDVRTIENVKTMRRFYEQVLAGENPLNAESFKLGRKLWNRGKRRLKFRDVSKLVKLMAQEGGSNE